MQIGWCSAKCKFTTDTGVGDTKYSYGLDGSKQRVWHVYTQKYGPYWRSGDIFGVCLDMDAGRIEYYRNGVGLGEAFADVEKGPGLALYPAVSMAFNDSLTANFGGSPFRHAVKGYRPLQKYPEAIAHQSDCLLQYLVNLARLISRQNSSNAAAQTSQLTPADKHDEGNEPSENTVYIVVSSILIERVTGLLMHSYVVEDKVFSFIRSMCVIRSEADNDNVIHPGSEKSTLGTFLTLLWNYMDEDDMSRFLRKVLSFLASIYKETPTDLEYERQRMVIVMLTCICNHARSRKFLLHNYFFSKNCLPLFLYIKPPDEIVLEHLLPDDNIWTEGIGGPEKLYFAACDKLQACTSILYTLQKNLMTTLMLNDDCSPAADAEPWEAVSSRKIFMVKFRAYVFENNVENRVFFMTQNNVPTPTQPAVGLSFLCILLDVTRGLWASECPDQPIVIQSNYFYDGTLNYTNVDRIGGVLSHLKKVHRNEIVTLLGEDHIEVSMNNANSSNVDRNDFSNDVGE